MANPLLLQMPSQWPHYWMDDFKNASNEKELEKVFMYISLLGTQYYISLVWSGNLNLNKF